MRRADENKRKSRTTKAIEFLQKHAHQHGISVSPAIDYRHFGDGSGRWLIRVPTNNPAIFVKSTEQFDWKNFERVEQFPRSRTRFSTQLRVLNDRIEGDRTPAYKADVELQVTLEVDGESVSVRRSVGAYASMHPQSIFSQAAKFGAPVFQEILNAHGYMQKPYL